MSPRTAWAPELLGFATWAETRGFVRVRTLALPIARIVRAHAERFR